ncbi:MAG: hypothetical protein NT007_11070 [Candidatus Kapabacteria bacterium]|nr:hypothetical protein [Candidatus Kapabacteria bacterium]
MINFVTKYCFQLFQVSYNILYHFLNELGIIVIYAHAGIPFQYQSGDSCIRTNDSLQVGNDIIQ